MTGFPEKHSFSGSGRVDGRQGGHGEAVKAEGVTAGPLANESELRYRYPLRRAEPAEQKISNHWGPLLVETGPFYMPVWPD